MKRCYEQNRKSWIDSLGESPDNSPDDIRDSEDRVVDHDHSSENVASPDDVEGSEVTLAPNFDMNNGEGPRIDPSGSRGRPRRNRNKPLRYRSVRCDKRRSLLWSPVGAKEEVGDCNVVLCRSVSKLCPIGHDLEIRYDKKHLRKILTTMLEVSDVSGFPLRLNDWWLRRRSPCQK